jgi:EAL domain-containing protein (putative c-di-GMP-specific phosphodiesterase class I)/CheY-like chemotaxis protein
VRVLIADDHADVRQVLAELVTSDESLELVGVAEDAAQTVALARARRPHVVLVDVKMPGGGATAARGILAFRRNTAVIAVSAFDDTEAVRKMFASGARSYILKGSAPGDILAAIHGGARGEPMVSPTVAGRVVADLMTLWNDERCLEDQRLLWDRRIRGIISGRLPLELHYQPLRDLQTDAVVGYEVLSRFRSLPTFPPDVWFSEAAALGRGAELETFVAARALSDLDRMPDTSLLALNVSPATILSGRLDAVLDLTEADRVILELTEHDRIDDYTTMTRALNALRRRGVRLAIDDAGAGYASMRHILELSPDLIKLDVSIIRGLFANAGNRALVSGLNDFGKETGATLVAEGIETSGEHAAARDLGVTLGQGFFLGMPEPIEIAVPSGPRPRT